jgi:hypothetical protein
MVPPCADDLTLIPLLPSHLVSPQAEVGFALVAEAGGIEELQATFAALALRG